MAIIKKFHIESIWDFLLGDGIFMNILPLALVVFISSLAQSILSSFKATIVLIFLLLISSLSLSNSGLKLPVLALIPAPS